MNISNQIIFSIIIPTRRRPRELENVFQDLAQQSKNAGLFEVLLFNDERDLKTEHLAQKSWPFPIQYFYSEEKSNSCRSRNTCLDHARGEWIIFLDDDVRFDSTFLTWINEQSKTHQLFSCRITKPPQNQKKRGLLKFLLQTFLRGKTLPLFGFSIEGYEDKLKKPVRVDHLVGAVMIVKHDLVQTIRFDEWIGEGTGFLDDLEFCKKIRQKHNIPAWYISSFDVLHLQASSGGNREHDQKRWYYYYQAHKIYFFKKYFRAYIPIILLSSFLEAIFRSIQKHTNLIPTYVRATRYGLAQTI